MKRLLTLVLAILCLHVNAQEEENKTNNFTISGSGDVYYRAPGEAPSTAFANLNGFALGMLNLKGEYAGQKTGVVADIALGPRGEDATFLSPLLRPNGTSGIINQLYIYWDVKENITLTLGNFNTFVGYEVISPVDNFNYSTSYLFSYGPFSHIGLKADFDLGNGFTAMGGVFNTTDETEYNFSDHYYGGAQVGYATDKLGLYFNTLFDNKNLQLDAVATYSIGSKTFTAINASWVKNSYSGIALYLQEEISDNFSMGLRGEIFMDHGIEVFGDKHSGEEVTISGQYKIGNLTLIPEARIDWTKEDYFEEKTKNSLASFLIAAVYGF